MKALSVLTIAVFTLLTCTIPALSATINIPDDYATIQAGIDASSDGDTVLVQPGTYVENINFNGRSIVLGSLYLTTGNTSYISSTIIDGDSSGTVVTVESGEDSTTIITGFTIQNGLSYVAGYGCGIYCSDSNLKISNNLITNNKSTGYTGGGISCINAHLRISNNTITSNFGNVVGGIFLDNTYADINNNTISNNTGIDGGGIMMWDNSFVAINNNIIMGNLSNGGGGILSYESTCEIIDNIIMNNIVDVSGGGIGLYDRNSAIIRGNIISGNSVTEGLVAYTGGGGIYCGTTDLLICNNNLILK